MPVASKYICHSIRRGPTNVSPEVLKSIGVGCHTSAASVERIARFAAKSLRVKLGAVYVKDVHRGHAHEGTGSITIPHWVIHGKPKPYAVYYVAHEVAHLVPNGQWGHDKRFKRAERRALKRFGMGIKYWRAYPQSLYALKDGKVLYEESHRRLPLPPQR